MGTAVLDLTTGQVRAFAAGVPVAWSPDGRILLTRSNSPERLLSLEVSTGVVRDLFTLAHRSPGASFVAFAPDGRQVALQSGQSVHIVDLTTGTSRSLADTGPDRRLAGSGAWRPDGTLALWRMVGCAHDCDPTELNRRRLTLSYVDSRHGTDVRGPYVDELAALGARLVGWQADGDAVVEVLPPETWRPAPTIGHSWLLDDTDLAGRPPRLLALHPGGGQEPLLALPEDARHVDVARDLVEGDRFGGPSPNLAARVADWLGTRPWPVMIVVLLAGMVLSLAAVRRHRSRLMRRRHP